MRKIATIAAVMALATAEAGASAQAVSAQSTGPAGISTTAAPGPNSSRRKLTDDPEKIVISLAALTEFILVFVIAFKKRHGGRPASP